MRGTLARLGRSPWLLLALAMAIASAVILVAGRGLSFSGDEFFYVGRLRHVPAHYDSITLEYLLAPHNGHLQVAGRLVYEAMFAVFGSDYGSFRVLELLVVLLCIGLFFELARRRVGDWIALLLAVLLCFLGAAWEVMIWPFDLDTTGALAAGLAALLVLERGGRSADTLACALLVLATAFVEVGVAFTVAVAVGVLIRPDRVRRVWVFAIPGLLFVVWYAWAAQFDSGAGGPENAPDVIPAIFDSLAAVLASLSGRLPTGAGVDVQLVGQSAFGPILAVIVLSLFAWRLLRGSLPATIWPLLAAVLVYWAFLGFAERDPDSSRYIFVGAILVLLIACDALRDRSPAPVAIACVGLLVAVALPANIAKLFDGADHLVDDAELVGGEFAMLELAGSSAEPDYVPGNDRVALDVGASPYVKTSPAVYRDAAERIGSLATPLDRVRAADVTQRQVDDVVLARALDLHLEPADPPPGSDTCARPTDVPFVLPAPPGGLTIEAGDEPVKLAVSRFVPELPIFDLGTIEAGESVRLDLPGPDAAPEPWNVFYDASIRVSPCAGASNG